MRKEVKNLERNFSQLNKDKLISETVKTLPTGASTVTLQPNIEQSGEEKSMSIT